MVTLRTSSQMHLEAVLTRMLAIWLPTVDKATPDSLPTSAGRSPSHSPRSTTPSATVSRCSRAKYATLNGSHTWRRPNTSSVAHASPASTGSHTGTTASDNGALLG